MTSRITTSGLDGVLRSANPLRTDQAGTLPLHDAVRELWLDLRDSVAAQPSPSSRAPRTRQRRRRLAVRMAVATAIVAGCATAALTLVPGSGRDGSGTAWAAELVRFAEASPLLLLDAPGSQVSYVDEQSQLQGEMQFSFRGESGSSRNPDRASLRWIDTRGLASRIEDRATSSDARTTATVLGATAQIFRYAGGKPGQRDITALWADGERGIEFRTTTTGFAAFKELLARLHRADADAWLSALPASAVRTADRRAVVAAMLEGVTVPPGFDPASIKGAELTSDRYQLGANVTGTVACAWFSRWLDARQRGDDARVREAIDALKTAKTWPILREMSRSGWYPQAIEDYAAAMPTGDWHGRPLEGELNQGLGCADRGVPIG